MLKKLLLLKSFINAILILLYTIYKGEIFMIKAVFFDVDGTLISFKTHKMPESTREALNKLREKGIKLFIATGRSPFALPKIKEILNFKFDGYVMLNGQYCIIDDKVIRDESLPLEGLKQVMPYMEKNKIACEFVEIDYTYLNFVNDRVLELRKFLGGTVADYEIQNPERALAEPTYQLCAYIKDYEEKEFFENMPGCRGVRWNPLFVDVINGKGGKSVGIKEMLNYLKISEDEAMAFGDGGNDIEMLQFVKYGIAMGNAGENVKKAAVYVARDIDDDGIYSALVRYNVI